MNPEGTQVLSLSEALTSLRHTYLGSVLLDPEDNRKLSIGAIWSLVGKQGSLNLEAIWNFSGASGLLSLIWGTKGRLKGLSASGP